MANSLIDIAKEKETLLTEYATLNDNREEANQDNPRFGEIESRLTELEREEKFASRAEWLTNKSQTRTSKSVSWTSNPEDRQNKDAEADCRDWVLNKPDGVRHMTFGTDTTGGYLQTNILDTRIRECVYENASLLPFMTIENQAGLDKRHYILDCDTGTAVAAPEYSGPSSGQGAGQQAPDRGDPALDRKVIALKKYTSGKIGVSREDAMNPNINFLDYIGTKLGRRLTRKIDQVSQIEVGDGDPTPEGVFTVAPTGKTLADKDAVTYDEILEWIYTLPHDVRHDPKTILCVTDRTLGLMRRMEIGSSGVKAWQGQYTNDATGKPILQIEGIRIVTTPYLADIGDALSMVGVLGKMDEHVALFATGELGSQLVKEYDIDADSWYLNHIQFFGCGYTSHPEDYLSALMTPAS